MKKLNIWTGSVITLSILVFVLAATTGVALAKLHFAEQAIEIHAVKTNHAEQDALRAREEVEDAILSCQEAERALQELSEAYRDLQNSTAEMRSELEGLPDAIAPPTGSDSKDWDTIQNEAGQRGREWADRVNQWVANLLGEDEE